jgi:hypothetical protein
MVAKARVLSNLKAIRVLLMADRVEDALALIDGFRARLEAPPSETPTGTQPKPPLRIIAGGRSASLLRQPRATR